MKVSTWVDPDLAERVRRAAEKEGRSVSQWLRLVLERELAVEARPAPAPEVARPASGGSRTEPSVVEVLMREGHAACDHDWGDKRQTSFGFVRDCRRGCGEVRKV